MDERHPTRHLPGNADAIDGEVRRLDDVKERLWSTGETLRKLAIDGWDGSARNSFEEFRHRFAHQWLITGDLHEDAARALERYHATLTELQGRVATADPNATNPATTADIARWSQQLSSEASAAATAIRQATQALANVPRLLDQSSPQAVAGTAPSIRVPMDESDNHHAGVDPRTAQSNPTLFRRRVQALNDEVLLARFITVGH